jgi:hypothetical protein
LLNSPLGFDLLTHVPCSFAVALVHPDDGPEENDQSQKQTSRESKHKFVICIDMTVECDHSEEEFGVTPKRVNNEYLERLCQKPEEEVNKVEEFLG